MLVEIYRYVVFHSHETVQVVVILLILLLGMITIIALISKKNAQLSSVAFFDPLTKWGNKRFLDEVFLPQLLLEAYIEAESDDSRDEAVHFIEARIANIESLKKLEQNILARLLTANIKKYLLHPADQCFTIDKGVFRVIITRKKVSRGDSEQFLQNIRTAVDDLILIYPTLESVVSTNMLSWAELAEDTLNETLSMSFDVSEENETDIETAQNKVGSRFSWIPNILTQVLNKKGQKMCTQLDS